MSKTFIFTIKIESNAFDYKKGDYVLIPVVSNNNYNARVKLENKHRGSEYPDYRITDCIECDQGLFRPIIKQKVK